MAIRVRTEQHSGGPPHSRLVGPANGATLGTVKPVSPAGLLIVVLLALAGCHREVSVATAVTLGADGRATEVMGSSVEAGGEVTGHFLARRIP